MPRGPAAFKQADVSRNIRAAVKAGLSTDHVAIKPDGTVIIMRQIGEALVPVDDLDRELAEFEARNGEG